MRVVAIRAVGADGQIAATSTASTIDANYSHGDTSRSTRPSGEPAAELRC